MTSREISPSDFDLIVVGTGFQESLLAAGAAKAGKKVLHIDTADFYGSHWASHQLGYFEKWCRMHASSAGPLYSNAEVYRGSDTDLGPSNEYNIDLAPKLIYCTGRLIDALLGGAAQNYLDLKLLQQSYVWRDGQYWQVPASKAMVFCNMTLEPMERNRLMHFLQRVQQHAKATQEGHEEGLWLDDRAFIEVLQEEQLTPQLQKTILYALAFADAAQLPPPQGAPEPGSMSHAQGMEALAQYVRSAGRYGDGTGAFLLPVYGGGELPQAFCRVAAVADALYVLRQGIQSFVMDANTSLCRALLTSSGQKLTAKAFAGNPETLFQFCRPEAPAAPPRGLSRAVLIFYAPLVKDMSQVLVVLPPGVAGNAHPVRALQLGQATACAPKDKYIVHLSTLQTAATAREDLQQAAQSLADLSSLQVSSSAADAAEAFSGDDGYTDSVAESQAAASSAAPAHAAENGGAAAASEARRKPRALFLAYYNQALQEDSQSSWELPQNVALCGMPSPSVAYEDAVLEAEGLLQQLFPDLDALFADRGPEPDDESDDEANEAMSEALGGIDGGESDQH